MIEEARGALTRLVVVKNDLGGPEPEDAEGLLLPQPLHHLRLLILPASAVKDHGTLLLLAWGGGCWL
jgi:hypothetical protein